MLNLSIKSLSLITIVAIIFSVGLSAPNEAQAASADELNADVQQALKNCYTEVKGSKNMVLAAEGVLIFPGILKAGFGIGGEYGEGALLIKGETVDYYSIAAASIGLQIGVQKKSMVIVFQDKSALDKFRNSSGWTAGADASIAVVNVGAGEKLDVSQHNKPIHAFVFGQKGLMYNVNLEGAKFTKIKK